MQDTRRDPSRADQVHDRLLADIVAGTYPLQSRLPPEEVLAQTCGVSRPVLRMALARLREDGIITSRRGSGNYVTRRPDRAVMDFVPLGSITDIRRCYEFRADVESAAAAWAARRRTEADLAAMEAAQAQLAGSYRQQQLGVDADHQLHRRVGVVVQTHVESDVARRGVEVLLQTSFDHTRCDTDQKLVHEEQRRHRPGHPGLEPSGRIGGVGVDVDGCWSGHR